MKYLPTFTLADPAVTQMATIGYFFSPTAPGCPERPATTSRGSALRPGSGALPPSPLPPQPYGSSYGYSNFGMTTGAGEAVATAAGMPWDQLCARPSLRPR